MSGDVLIKVNVQPDKYFRREGNDIYTTAYLTVSEVFIIIISVSVIILLIIYKINILFRLF